MLVNRFFLLFIAYFLFNCVYAQGFKEKEQNWEEGWFEIHHINAKLGNSVFFIFPDGTTLLYDAGQLDYDSMSDKKKDEYCLSESDTVSVAKQIHEYISNVYPSALNGIDYVVISHFHDDHYGHVNEDCPKSKKGNYRLSGITELYEYIHFRHLIDRGYPDYSYPFELEDYYSKIGGDKKLTFLNYLGFVDFMIEKGLTSVECLRVGETKQIITKSENSYNFTVRNLKQNNEYWTGNKSEIALLDFSESPLVKDGKFNENPLSIALLFSYGNFKYYIGGDISGVDNWPDVDIETTLAPIIGKVDAMSLHHHGYKDASNYFFLKTLNPQVIVHQSLHIPHFQMNVLSRIHKQGGDAFALYFPANISQEVRNIVEQTYKDYNAHIVIRVKPDGKTFFVDTYEYKDSQLIRKQNCGPYYSLKK